MVKLGEYSASPQIVTSTVEAISNGIRNQLSDSLPIESATSADNDFEDELFKDWWDEANKARLFRLSQHIYEESESSGRDQPHIDEGDVAQAFMSNISHLLSRMYVFLQEHALYTHVLIARLLRRHLTFEYFIGEPMIPPGGVIMLVLMAHNKRPRSLALILLLAAFLLQVNPLYVLGGYGLYLSRKVAKSLVLYYTKQGKRSKDSADVKILSMPSSTPQTVSELVSYRPEVLQQYLNGTPTSSDTTNSNSEPHVVDVILLGGDLGTLYTAGLLSQRGMKCLVLQPRNCQPTSVAASGLPTAFLDNMSVGNPLRTQMLFENVLRIRGCTNQKRVVLKPIGTRANDFAHSVIRVKNVLKKNQKEDIVILRAGEDHALMKDIHSAAGSSLPSNITQRLSAEKSNEVPSPFSAIYRFFQYLHYASDHLLSPYLMLKVGNKSRTSPVRKVNAVVLFIQSLLGLHESYSELSNKHVQDIQNLGTLSVSGLLSQTLRCMEPSSASIQKCYSHMAAIAAAVGADEYISPDLLSGINVPYALGQAKDGLFAPVGGCEAVTDSLHAVIRCAGGRVVKNVDIDALLFADDRPRHLTGVRVLVEGNDMVKSVNIYCTHGVVSGLGMMHTHLMLHRMRPQPFEASHTEPRSLLNACEARPKLHCVFWIKASCWGESGLEDFDYFEYPSCSPPEVKATEGDATTERKPPGYLTSAAGTDDMTTGGVWVEDYVKIWSPTAKDAAWADGKHSSVQIVIVELEAGDSLVKKVIYPVHTTLPSAAETTSGSVPSAKVTGACAFYVPTTSSAAPKDFPIGGAKVELSEPQVSEVMDHARGKLCSLYPQLSGEGCILEQSLVAGHTGGRKLSSVAHKFSIHRDVQVSSACEGVENLYLCGADVGFSGLAGILQGGAGAANCLLGYSSEDLLAGDSVLTSLVS